MSKTDKKTDKKIDELAKVGLFSGCGPKELRRLASITDRIDLPDGRLLCREGSVAHECFVIIEGTVRVSIEGRTVSTVGAGEALGEMALLSHRPRVATATTDGPVSAYVIHANQFASLIEETPSIAVAMLHTLSDRLAELETVSS